ncbi:unnamed protein product [Cylindrotheca closterium]|uniref:DUF6824 domain-containing protein n=1 Tax=Cylindrotheca closterium TaxID=2856 RepID=A0AAD2FJ33_9STRA|nr:unnamed protein product [Cylindrotheca closterium]
MTLPTRNDVMATRGLCANQHPGNQYFTQLVRDRLDEYINTNRRARRPIIEAIVSRVQATGGRFLRYVGNGDWLEITNKDAVSKTSHYFRDEARRLRTSCFSNWPNWKVDQLCSTLRATSTMKDLDIKFFGRTNFEKLIRALMENQSLEKLTMNLTRCQDSPTAEAMVSTLCLAISSHPELASVTILVPESLGEVSTTAIIDLIRGSSTLQELRVVDSTSLSTAVAPATTPQHNRDYASELMQVLGENRHLKILAIPRNIAGGLIRFSDFMNFIWNHPRIESASLLGMDEKETAEADLKEVTAFSHRIVPLVWEIDSKMANRCQESVCQLLEAHPEILIKPARTTPFCNTLPPRLQLLADFHRGGRYLLQQPDLLLSVWPHNVMIAERVVNPDVIFEFLKQGPFFAGRMGVEVQGSEPPSPQNKKEFDNSRKRKSDEMVNADLADAMD